MQSNVRFFLIHASTQTNGRWAAAILFAGVAISASAQPVKVAEPASSAPPVYLQPAENDSGVTNLAAAPLQWGIVSARPHVNYRLTRGNGIQATPGQQITTTINTFSPGVLLQAGKHWSLDYTPTWTFYSTSAFNDSLDHLVTLTGTAGFTDGNLALSEVFSSADSPRIETGRQTHEEANTVGLTLNYRLGRKTRIEVGLSQGLRYIESAPNSNEWTTQDWYHYQFSNRLDAAVGVAVGYVIVQPGTDMDYTRPQLRIGWKPSRKVGLDVHGGAEHRRFRRAGSPSLNTPNYGGSGFYQPLETTTLSISADRGVSVSYFAGEVNENTTWSVGLDQRLLQRFTFNASAGRTNSRYIPSNRNVIVTSREDLSHLYTVRLSTTFLRRGTVGVVYQHTRNSSDVAVYSFTSNQIGLEIGYRY